MSCKICVFAENQETLKLTDFVMEFGGESFSTPLQTGGAAGTGAPVCRQPAAPGSYPPLLGVDPEHVGLFVSQDAAFTHQDLVSIPPQPRPADHLLRFHRVRQRNGLIWFKGEFVSG